MMRKYQMSHTTKQPATGGVVEISSDDSSDSFNDVYNEATPLTALERALEKSDADRSNKRKATQSDSDNEKLPRPSLKRNKLEPCINSSPVAPAETPTAETKKRVHFDEASKPAASGGSDEESGDDEAVIHTNSGTAAQTEAEKEQPKSPGVLRRERRTQRKAAEAKALGIQDWQEFKLDPNYKSKNQLKRERKAAEKKAKQTENAQANPAPLTNNPKSRKQLKRERRAALAARNSQSALNTTTDAQQPEQQENGGVQRVPENSAHLQGQPQLPVPSQKHIRIGNAFKDFALKKLKETRQDFEAVEAGLQLAMDFLQTRKKIKTKHAQPKQQSKEDAKGFMRQKKESKRELKKQRRELQEKRTAENKAKKERDRARHIAEEQLNAARQRREMEFIYSDEWAKQQKVKIKQEPRADQPMVKIKKEFIKQEPMD